MSATVVTLDLFEVDASGARKPIHIEIARPCRDSSGAWRCAVLADGVKPKDIFGEDSSQALHLGLEFLKARLHLVLQRGSRLDDPITAGDFSIDTYFNDPPRSL